MQETVYEYKKKCLKLIELCYLLFNEWKKRKKWKSTEYNKI